MFFCLPASSKGCCLNPKEWCFWALGTGHPLSSIQHPLEDPGMSTVIGRGYVPIDRYVSHSKPRFSSPEIFCQTDIYIYIYIYFIIQHPGAFLQTFAVHAFLQEKR